MQKIVLLQRCRWGRLSQLRGAAEEAELRVMLAPPNASWLWRDAPERILAVANQRGDTSCGDTKACRPIGHLQTDQSTQTSRPSHVQHLSFRDGLRITLPHILFSSKAATTCMYNLLCNTRAKTETLAGGWEHSSQNGATYENKLLLRWTKGSSTPTTSLQPKIIRLRNLRKKQAWPPEYPRGTRTKP